MLYRIAFLIAALAAVLSASALATEVDEDQPGGWCMVFFNKDFAGSRFGFQGDIQYRTWSPTLRISNPPMQRGTRH